jgi:diaminohydroxyphosphoribosylaminopyrimidine deaminase/5-amino-6-(5-phosphoribosylamino)uracil reductase
LLVARPPGPRVAARVVLDGRGRMPVDCQLTRTLGVAPLIVATTESAPADWREALEARGAEVLVLPQPGDAPGRIEIATLLEECGRRRWTHLLVEGGSDTLGSFFDAQLVDECHVFVAPVIAGGSTAPGPVGGRGLEELNRRGFRSKWEILDGDAYLCLRLPP